MVGIPPVSHKTPARFAAWSRFGQSGFADSAPPGFRGLLSFQHQDLPDHTGRVGSDIRNCCRTAYRLNKPIVEAAQYITLAGRTARADIEKLRDMAEQLGFLSASQPGVYRRPEKANGRAITL